MSKWPTVKLCDVAPASESKKPINDREVWLLNLDMVESGSGRIIDKIYVNQGKIGSSTIKFDERNVLYSKLRPYLNKVVLPDQTGYATSEMIPLRPDESRLIREYLAFFLRSPNFINYISSRVAGTKMPRANMNDLRAAQIPLPPISVQRRIVASLDAVSEVLRLRKAQLAELDNLVKSQFVEMFGDPVENPMGWDRKTLAHVCTKLTDGTHFSPESYETGDFKYITAKNIKADGFDFSTLTYVNSDVHNEIYARCNPEYGDVLYIKDGATTGIAMINNLQEQFTMLSSVALLKYDRSLIDGYYLRETLNNKSMYSAIRMNMGGAAITRLTIAKLNAIEIPLPPIDVQKKFASMLEQADKLKFTIQQSLDETQRLFDSLMAEYFED